MLSAMEKLSNMGSVAKEKFSICRAKVEEKVEKSTVKTAEGRKIIEERRKAKEAAAKMELHNAKAKHAAQKLRKSHRHGAHHQPALGVAAPPLSDPIHPPLGGHVHPIHHANKY